MPEMRPASRRDHSSLGARPTPDRASSRSLELIPLTRSPEGRDRGDATKAPEHGRMSIDPDADASNPRDSAIAGFEEAREARHTRERLVTGEAPTLDRRALAAS